MLTRSSLDESKRGNTLKKKRLSQHSTHTVLFVKMSTADVAALYHQREKEEGLYDLGSFIFSLLFYFFFVDYWFVVCFRFLRACCFSSLFFYMRGLVSPLYTTPMFWREFSRLVYNPVTLWLMSLADSACSLYASNRTLLLFFVPTRQIGV